MYRFHVSTIDISAWVGRGPEAARAAVVAAVDHACRTVGFMQIVGHGVPDRVISDLEEALDDFFGLPLDAKKQYVRPAAENRGYTPPKSESLSYSLGIDPVTRMNDFFEAFNVGTSWRDYPGTTATPADYAENTWPDVTPAFRGAVEAYYDEARRVAQTLTRVFAAALRVPDDSFDALTDHSIDVLRMNNYALPPGSIELGAELTGMGEHTDFGLVTVLWADRCRGAAGAGTGRVVERRHAGRGRAAGEHRRRGRAAHERQVAVDAAPGEAARDRRDDRAAPLGGVLPRRQRRRGGRGAPPLRVARVARALRAGDRRAAHRREARRIPRRTQERVGGARSRAGQREPRLSPAPRAGASGATRHAAWDTRHPA